MSKDIEQTDPTEKELIEVIEDRSQKPDKENLRTVVELEYAPLAMKFLTKEKFDEWMHIGEDISKESRAFGIAYYKNLLSALEKSSSTYHGDLLRTARMLLDKDWMLAGVFFENLPDAAENTGPEGIRKWAGTGIKIFDQNKDLSIDYFSYSAPLLKDLEVSELEEWALNGIDIFEENPSLGRPYFSLRSKNSKEFIEGLKGSAALNQIVSILRYYALGLTGVNFNILSRRMLQMEEELNGINPVIAGRTIYLAPRICKYSGFEDNFRIYKLSIMHEVGHIQFSSHKIELERASGLMADIRRRYTTIKKRTYLSGLQPEGIVGIAEIIAMFPNQTLAGTILGILEDARVEYRIMEHYRGVRLDLERIRYQMLQSRPAPAGDIEEFMESLLWISTGNEPVYNICKGTKVFLDQVRTLLKDRIFHERSSILDSLDTTFRIYIMLDDQIGPLSQKEYDVLKNIDYRGVDIGAYGKKGPLSPSSYENTVRNFIPKGEVEPTEEKEKTQEEKVKLQSTYAADKNWKILGSYMYEEWDALLNDYKADWCTVNEIEPSGISSDYYKDASERYRNEIALIQRIFSRMKPEAFRRMKEQIDGTEIDIDAFVDVLIQKKCGINPDDRLYLRWDKHERDVATLFLIDVSYSTHKMVGYEGKSIMDVEKDSLIIMIQALESIGDKYAIYAFSGQTRDDVEYFAIKEFDDELSDNVERRISLLEPVSNTRLGPAIRHSIRKLDKVNAKTKIIILLSDGEPFDTSRGESAYKGRIAEEDTRIAIMEGNARGIHFFCITVDSNPGKYLDNIFSDTGYTIIDDASLLPESLPMLYKRITT
ncbi:nitric oxide reductase activation protein NorD [Methanolobus halotolerans]|nr:VWA domain-containing protein [Methanolobus halotolerans]